MKIALCFILTLMLTSFLTAQIPTNGLVAWYPFNGNANDESGNGNNGTVYGAQLDTNRFGTPGQAYLFDGVDDYILVPDAASLNPVKEITIAAWIKWSGSGNSHPYILSKRGGTFSSQYEFQLTTYSLASLSSGPRFRSWIMMNTPHGWIPSTNYNISPGKWYFLVFTYDKTMLKIYVNGLLNNDGPDTTDLAITPGPLCIGKRAVYGTGPFNGVIDDIRIYSEALDYGQIQSLFNERPDSSGQSAYLPNSLSCLQSSDIEDSSKVFDNDTSTFGYLSMSDSSVSYTKYAILDFTVPKSIKGLKVKYSFPTTAVSPCHGYPGSITYTCGMRLLYRNNSTWIVAAETGNLNTGWKPDICEVVDSAELYIPNPFRASEWKFEMSGMYGLSSISQTTAYFKVFEVQFKETDFYEPVPVVHDTTICGAGPLTLTASGGTNYNWYNAKAGCNAIATGLTMTIPYLSQSDTLWVSSCNDSSESQRVPVFLNVDEPLITGKLTYDNSANTPLSSIRIYIRTLSGQLVDSATTDQNGDYRFCNIPDGSYYLTGKTDKAWGGVNNADALLVLKHFVGISYLTGLRLKASDVNLSGYVNTSDAFGIQKRFAGVINTFPAGDWVFSDPQVTLNGASTQVVDFQGICVGDVNGSYVPPQK